MLYEELSRLGLNIFLDYEELNNGYFNEKLYDAIENSKNVIIVLSKDSLNRCVNLNDWMTLEIKHAMETGVDIIPIMIEVFIFPDDIGEIEKLKMIQAVQYSRAYHKESLDRIVSRLSSIAMDNQIGEKKLKAQERSENKYFGDSNRTKELRRLNNQKRILKNFDKDVYEKVTRLYDDMVILDLGSNRGDLIIDRLGGADNLSKLLGIEYDEKVVNVANEKYGKDGVIEFFQADVESDDFSDKLEEAMNKMCIEEFNVIHISMLLLHLGKPFGLLKIIRRYLSSDGILVIKDIDDGLNISYPDEQNEFQRVVDIVNTLETAGYRHCGRQIYTLLKRTGYHNVVLEKMV